MVFRDKTFCASPNCKNECGRQMNPFEKNELDFRRECALSEDGDADIIAVSWGYFCGEPDDKIQEG